MAKHVRTEIIVNERFKIVHVDSLNWQVFEFREIKDKGSTTRAGESDWIALPAFFGYPEHAIEWIARKHYADSGEAYESMQVAAKAFRAANKELLKSLAELLESR